MLFKELQTDRLLLKNISSDDREFIFSQFSDNVVNRYLFDAEPLINVQGADNIIEFYLQPEPRLQHRWVLVRKEDGIRIGTCGFHCWNMNDNTCDVGYDLKEIYWGKGYMAEAMETIISFAYEQMNLKKINACIYVDNGRSIKLAEKLGFKFNGETQMVSFRGKVYEHKIFTLDLGIL
ncbi:GNAT family N-acetyltransferase [Desulfosporosinus sp. PR]|uniref:GNAT family N-acetyltransferase n=1 Tax=Candidatus Desulfosporosinus nitrosoreducens TaxID=3401928 RepID=UPI0027F08151|nr:GNAT family N-acetyltransferase [Desulfosporosinus sp. PR]MDQ7092892.1 GNAT family N-acetyltransferase [Desulfosporosinus sp. PR]